MSAATKVDVTILGGGPVGSFLAVVLDDMGVSNIVVDRDAVRVRALVEAAAHQLRGAGARSRRFERVRRAGMRVSGPGQRTSYFSMIAIAS